MIKLEDIKFEARRKVAKTGCLMMAWCLMPYDRREIYFEEHDYGADNITEAFKERALEVMNKVWREYENKLTTKIKRWWQKWISLPKQREI